VTVRVFRNARIHPSTRSRSIVGALAVEAGFVVAAGTEAEVREAVGSGAELIDLEGAAVIPGLYDAHIHTASYARQLSAVDLREARSLEDALARVTEHTVGLDEGAWVFGGRWNSNVWERPVQPDRHALDAVCPDRPVALSSVDGHTMWTNSRGLASVGIDRDTPDPVGGQIVRDEAGEPTGILRESAMYPLRALAESAGSGDLRAQLRVAQEHLLAVGLTSIHDIDGEDCRAAYLDLHRAGELKLRVHKAIPVAHLDAAIAEGRVTGQGDDWFRTGPVKLFSDGALGSHTCHMNEPFAGQDGNVGIAVTRYDDLVRLVRTANTAGIAVATHAIGDRANQLVLDAYAAVGAPRHLRNRIEHAQHVRPRDIARFVRLGVIASMQPTHCTTDIDLASTMLAGRDLASYAWRDMLSSGVGLAFGSDAPVELPNPFHGLFAATTRTRADGAPSGGWTPEQRLSIGEALTAYTAGSAFAAGEEGRKGTLAPGRLADLVALDTDPFTEPPDAVRRTRVLTTVVGGEVRWQESSRQ
jgi:predicted amidohydrolase YtcJ